MSIIEKIIIWLTSNYIGVDEFGHQYYLSRSVDYLGRRKRYVIYHGIVEASKIPPMWHAWMHHLTDDVPLKGKSSNHGWQSGFIPNLTGTKLAYLPSGVKGKRDAVIADYKRWIP
jgi:NADH:ubiquinone oxidoreductase subunit